MRNAFYLFILTLSFGAFAQDAPPAFLKDLLKAVNGDEPMRPYTLSKPTKIFKSYTLSNKASETKENLRYMVLAGDSSRFTPHVQQMIESWLQEKNNLLTEKDVADFMRRFEMLPSYKYTFWKLKKVKSGNALIIIFPTVKENTIAFMANNAFSDLVGPLNGTLGYTTSSLFQDHDALTLYAKASETAREYHLFGLDYQYLLTDSGIMHGFSYSYNKTNPLDPSIPISSDKNNQLFRTYLKIPVFMSATEKFVVTPYLAHHIGVSTALVNNVTLKTKRVYTTAGVQALYSLKDTVFQSANTVVRGNFVKGLGLGFDKITAQDHPSKHAWAVLLGIERKESLPYGFHLTPSIDVQVGSRKAKNTGPYQNYGFGGQPHQTAYAKNQVWGQTGYRWQVKLDWHNFVYSYLNGGRIRDANMNASTVNTHVRSYGFGIQLPLFGFSALQADYGIPLKKINNGTRYKKDLVITWSSNWSF